MNSQEGPVGTINCETQDIFVMPHICINCFIRRKNGNFCPDKVQPDKKKVSHRGLIEVLVVDTDNKEDESTIPQSLPVV